MSTTAPGQVRPRNDWPAAGTIVAVSDGQVGGLWVLESNARARRFYARAGFTADGSAKQEDIAGSPVTEVRYRRPLP
jgi:hypothetical protein